MQRNWLKKAFTPFAPSPHPPTVPLIVLAKIDSLEDAVIRTALQQTVGETWE